MKLAWYTFSISLLLVQLSYAREFKAISGEHSDFSRIVIFFDEPTEWKLGRAPEGYFLQYEGAGATMNVDDIFQFIPRTRLREIENIPERNMVKFHLNCNCHADAFDLRNGGLALDFKDGRAPRNSPFEAPIDTLVEDELVAEQSSPRENLPTDFIDTSSASDFRNTLVKSMAKVLTEGVATQPTEGEPLKNLEVDRTIFGTDRVTEPLVPEETYDPLRTIDNEISIHCFDDIFQKLEVKSDIEYGSIAEVRAGVINSNFVKDTSNIILLAERSLYLGLGAEAIQLIDSVPDDFVNKPVMVAIANVIDSSEINSDQIVEFFSDKESCEGAINLWAFAVGFQESASEPEKLNEILKNFLSLSPFLKKILANRMISQLDSEKNRDEIRIINRAIEGSSVGAGVDSFRTSDRLTELTDSQIDTLRRSNSELSSQATLLLAQRTIERGDLALSSFVTDVDGLSYELRGSKLGNELLSALTRIHSIRGDFAQAFMALDRLHNQDQSLADEISEEIFEKFVEVSTDEEIVVLVSQWNDLIVKANLSESVWNEVSLRVGQSGLPSLAAKLVEQKFVSEQFADLVLVRSRWQEGRAFEGTSPGTQLRTESDRLFEIVAAQNNVIPDFALQKSRERLELPSAQRLQWLTDPASLEDVPVESRYSRASHFSRNFPGSLVEPMDLSSQRNLEDFEEVSGSATRRLSELSDFLDIFSFAGES